MAVSDHVTPLPSALFMSNWLNPRRNIWKQPSCFGLVCLVLDSPTAGFWISRQSPEHSATSSGVVLSSRGSSLCVRCLIRGFQKQPTHGSQKSQLPPRSSRLAISAWKDFWVQHGFTLMKRPSESFELASPEASLGLFPTVKRLLPYQISLLSFPRGKVSRETVERFL